MKRSVFILMLSLAAHKFAALAPATITSLPAAHCDALSIKPKVVISINNQQVSRNSVYKSKYVLEPLKNKLPHSQSFFQNEPIFILPENGDIKQIREPFQTRKEIQKHKPHVPNPSNNEVKVPP